jgi:hypothetical protein
MFDNCVENSFYPKVVVLCGNFTSRSISQGNARDVQRYQGAFPTSRGTRLFPLIPGLHDREFRRLGRLDSILPCNHSQHALRLGARTSGHYAEFGSSQAAIIIILCISHEKQSAKSAFRNEPVSYKVLWAGDCDIPRGHDGEDA